MKIKVRSIICISYFALLIVVPMTSVVSAAEITPDESTYVLGSTSEFSAGDAQNVAGEGVATGSGGDSLANTGQNVELIIIACIAMLGLFLLSLYKGIHIRNET